MAKKPAKSETLTLRLDPKTRFMLEFVARLRGQTITTVFERAIHDAADRATLVTKFNMMFSWKDFWDIEEGIRTIKIAANEALRPTFEEEKMLKFTQKFWPFFYVNRLGEEIERHYISILWGRIEEFILIDDEAKTSEYWAAGEKMEIALRQAGVNPPSWKIELKMEHLIREDEFPF